METTIMGCMGILLGYLRLLLRNFKASYHNRETLVFNIYPCSGKLTLKATQYLELRDM